METISAKRQIHVGQNIQKFRNIRNKSQLDMAIELEEKLGKAVSQQLISDIEKRETIEDELLKQIAEILKVDDEVLKNLDWEDALNIIANNFQDYAIQQINYKNVVNNNPLDKLIELFEKEKAELKNENQQLKKEVEELKKGKK